MPAFIILGFGFRKHTVFQLLTRICHQAKIFFSRHLSPDKTRKSHLDSDVTSKERRPKSGGIHVFIRTHDGLRIQKKGLNYQDLVKLVEKLEGLC